jgi:hypothetical protein
MGRGGNRSARNAEVIHRINGLRCCVISVRSSIRGKKARKSCRRRRAVTAVVRTSLQAESQLAWFRTDQQLGNN